MPIDAIPEEEIQLVTFRIDGHHFAFNVFEIERVLRYETPSPLPKSPNFLEGVLQYGGDFLPIVDLRKRLEVTPGTGPDTRTIVADWEQGKIGLVVDAVTALLKVPVGAIKAPPSIVRGLAADYVSGVLARGGETIVVLAMSRLLTSEERLQLETFVPEMVND